MLVRPLAKDDIPQVADLYWTILRECKGPTPPAVQSFLQELYFTDPWIDSSLPSLVSTRRGRLRDFSVPRSMLFQGRCLAFGG